MCHSCQPAPAHLFTAMTHLSRRAHLWGTEAVSENSLFVKAKKCEFHAPSMSFLAFIIKQGQLSPDPAKVQGRCGLADSFNPKHFLGSPLLFFPGSEAGEVTQDPRTRLSSRTAWLVVPPGTSCCMWSRGFWLHGS